MKIDLHNHTYYSRDAVSSPEQIIKTALRKGVDGIAITDHDTTAGWPEAISAAKKLGAFLILGEEITTKEGDVLGLFLKKEIKERDTMKAIREIKNQGGIAVIPHPFHLFQRFKGDLQRYKDVIDGIEVFNAKFPFRRPDIKAFNFAKENNLAMTGGSDTHQYPEAGNGYTLAFDAKNIDDFKRAILERKTIGDGKKTALLHYLIFPGLKRLGIIKKL